MAEKSTSKKGRIVATVTEAVLVAAVALTGTFALYDFLQHGTNPFGADNLLDVTLNDSFTPPDNWDEGLAVDKKVSVTNLSTSTQNAYVRLQFKEYMEAYGLIPVQENGENVLFATFASGEKKGEFMTWAEADGYDYEKYTVTYADGKTADFARTQNSELRDGIYGKAMYIPGNLEVYGTAAKASYPNQEHTGQTTDECAYNVHMWDGTGIENQTTSGSYIHDFISWTLGGQVVTMTDWAAAGSPTGSFWVLDEEDGWVYWASALAPGESTTNILEAVTLIAVPGAQMEYYIHIDMEAVTLYELTRPDGEAKWQDGTDTTGTSSSDGAKDLFTGFVNQPAPGWTDNGDGTSSKWVVDENGDLTEVIADVMLGKDGTIYRPTGIEDVYEVMQNDGTSQTPPSYIWDMDGSIAADGEVNGDERACTDDGSIPFDLTTFPDENFFTFLQNIGVDNDGDGLLTPQERKSVETIDTYNTVGVPRPTGTTDVTGIEVFSELTSLSLEGCRIREVDLSYFKVLTYLGLDGCPLDTLDTSGNPELQRIILDGASITSLDFSKNTKLKEFYGEELFGITEIDLTQWPSIEKFTWLYGRIDELILSSTIEYLSLNNLGYRQSTVFDATAGTSLKVLSIHQIGVKGVILPEGLTSFVCSSNPIDELDVSMCPQLTAIYCDDCDMKKLYVTQAQFDTGMSDASHENVWEYNPELQIIIVD